jgi:osmotically-inducible protein OsmY
MIEKEHLMRQEKDSARIPSSPVLPLIVAAFAGATLAIACERPDSRAAAQTSMSRESATASRASPSVRPEAPVAQPAPAPAATREALNDTMITGRIKAAILTDPAMAGADVSVNTDHGVVSLTGVVRSHEQTGVASGHAQRQDGVMRVDTHLSLSPQ